MPRQVDQLPPDATSLARRVQALEREVRELRASRRLTSATLGLVQTATDGARVALDQRTKSLRVYADDGTLLAELGPEDNGGGGLWTRGLQSPNNYSAYLASGELQFRPVENNLVTYPGGLAYETDAFQYSDLVLTSGAVAPTDHRPLLILESLYDGQRPYVYVQGEDSSPCNLDVLGTFTAGNMAWGSTSITPSGANVPTSASVTGLNVDGSSFIALVSANSSVPGSQVTGVSFNNLTHSGLTLWLTRTNTTTTIVNWLVIGI